METGNSRRIKWYEVAYVVVLLAVLAWSVFFMNPHKTAVVDLDRVFKDVGMLQKIEKQRQKLDFFNKGTTLLKAYNIRIKGLQEKLATAKTQSEKDKINAQLKSSSELFQESIGPIQTAMQRFDAGAVASFRKRVQPFINQIAQKRGVDVVLFNGPNVLYAGNKADLTAAVTEAAQEFFAKDIPVIDPSVEPTGLRR